MKDYVEKAVLTENKNTEQVIERLDAQTVRSIHAIMGILTETAEIIEATTDVEIKDEVGDILWYMALFCDARGIYFNGMLEEAEQESNNYPPFLSSNIMIPFGLMREGSTLLDIFKKRMFYYKPVDEKSVSVITKKIFKYIVAYCNQEKVDIKEAMEKNIQKLAARYPDKFKSSDAINRDVSKEKRIYEG
jgi:NTP pyrophosphatase (non-canonical NTP hydrolase)